ncbi:MAG TPA: hypothetical protein VM285_08600 [Polyangia bacterium]|nr:hypothetical protein [Polyangia bacterium]HUW17662.1 hypothetical protein [Actinomycetes bacterium]
MAKASDTGLLVVKTSFACALGDFVKGETIEAGHPAVKKYADHFEPLVVKHAAPASRVEQATAGPGEKRGA